MDSFDVVLRKHALTVSGCWARVLAGEDVPLGVWAEVEPRSLVNSAKRHGVLPLVADRLAGVPGMPANLVDVLEREASRIAAKDLRREAELRRLIGACARAGIEVLLFKGAALAYRVYARPDLRVRADTDLLIAPERREAGHDVLMGLGYEPLRQVEGELVMHQTAYVLRDRQGATVHEVDLHWRLTNPAVFADLPSFAELWPSAEPLDRLAAGARGLGAAHALLIACVHRVAHHFDAADLIWFYDIHLLATAMGREEWASFVEAAGSARVASTCRRSLELTRERFGTPVPDDVVAGLQQAADRGQPEASAAYLSSGRRPIDDVVSDLRVLPTWAARTRLVYEHLFPSRRYMREVYGQNSHAPLTALYVWRAVRGARKWLSRR